MSYTNEYMILFKKIIGKNISSIYKYKVWKQHIFDFEAKYIVILNF